MTDGLATEAITSEQASLSRRGEARVWDIAKELADKGKIYVIMSAPSEAPAGLTAGNYRSPDDRHRMYGLASYWMARQGESTYFAQYAKWQPLRTFWMKAQEHDIGQPRGDYYEWKENSTAGDSAGQKFRVYRRDYEKAILLFRTRYDWDEKNFKTFDGRTEKFDLGGEYRMLYPDGSLGPAISRIGLCLAEGVVLVPAGGIAPQPESR